VLYRSDVHPAAERILTEFQRIQDRRFEHEDPSHFGYEARHFVCLIPQDIHVRCYSPVHFFELQASTLFQHAWAEANHDLVQVCHVLAARGVV
jgi:putative GTP pyrophosphokinase